MSKKIIISIFIILALGMGTLISVIFLNIEPAPEPFLCNGQPCNVILIIPETLSARHMGIYGYERDTTPFIDEFFSEESLIFESAWSASSWTLPSFAALFTSQLASDVFVERREDKLSDKIPTFVDVLSQNKIPKLAAHSVTLLPRPNLHFNLITQFEEEERFLAKDHLLFLKVIEWIEEQTQREELKPFFILLQPYASHEPYDAPEPYRYFFDAPSEYLGSVTFNDLRGVEKAFRERKEVEKELRRFRLQYDQEIRYLDNEFESLIARIPEQVLRNTVFIFTSDHGEAFLQHNSIGHGGTPYEELIHVPFLIRAPGLEQKRIQEPITLLDAGPTILEIFGLRSPGTFQGISLVPALRGERLFLKDRIVRSEVARVRNLPFEQWSEIKQEVRATQLPVSREYAVRKGNWKILQLHDGSLELYNLKQDYYEQNNLISQLHDLSQEERAEIIPLFEALGESPPPEAQEAGAQEGNWNLLRNQDGSLELYNLKQDPEQQNNLLNNDGIPQWHYLSREEQLEVAPLFEELDEEPPFIKLKD